MLHTPYDRVKLHIKFVLIVILNDGVQVTFHRRNKQGIKFVIDSMLISPVE